MASGLAGIGSVSAIALSIADMVNRGDVATHVGAVALLIALTINGLVKWILSLTNGSRELAFWLGGGLLSMLTVGALLILSGHP